jgi:uncharacterized repeat protein (TIGR01451 family)
MPGDKVTFTITVFNQGMIDADNIEITDYVPTGFTFVAADNPTWATDATIVLTDFPGCRNDTGTGCECKCQYRTNGEWGTLTSESAGQRSGDQ